MRVSRPAHDISRRAWFSSVPRTFGSGTEQDWPPEPRHRFARGKELPLEEMKTAKCGSDLESVIV